MLRPGPRTGVDRGPHLLVRMHVLRDVHGDGARRRLPELRRRVARPAPPPRGEAGAVSGIDGAGLQAGAMPLRRHRSTRCPVTEPSPFPLEGGCNCRAVRYRDAGAPLFVHCCHCRWCQRESGACLRAQRDDRGRSGGAAPRATTETVLTPSASGKGQKIVRCPHAASRCGATTRARATRSASCASARSTTPDRAAAGHPHLHGVEAAVGACCRPGTPAVPEYYDRERHWPAESLARRAALLPQIEAHRATLSARS